MRLSVLDMVEMNIRSRGTRSQKRLQSLVHCPRNRKKKLSSWCSLVQSTARTKLVHITGRSSSFPQNGTLDLTWVTHFWLNKLQTTFLFFSEPPMIPPESSHWPQMSNDKNFVLQQRPHHDRRVCRLITEVKSPEWGDVTWTQDAPAGNVSSNELFATSCVRRRVIVAWSSRISNRCPLCCGDCCQIRARHAQDLWLQVFFQSFRSRLCETALSFGSKIVSRKLRCDFFKWNRITSVQSMERPIGVVKVTRSHAHSRTARIVGQCRNPVGVDTITFPVLCLRPHLDVTSDTTTYLSVWFCKDSHGDASVFLHLDQNCFLASTASFWNQCWRQLSWTILLFVGQRFVIVINRMFVMLFCVPG